MAATYTYAYLYPSAPTLHSQFSRIYSILKSWNIWELSTWVGAPAPFALPSPREHVIANAANMHNAYYF